ncbi:hypothetical protein [Paraburkholderia sp. J41]|uniref:hypothetical protein n=1 Tax=Paraburkholderia sp. J41 TaxID=2805433 RepID=UPI002AC33C99|nr:hypothetical protein [Paraburkholderia sp. J41]
MNESPRKARRKNPVFGVGVLIVVVVLVVIGTVLFNALRSKREYDETVGAARAGSTSATASAPASQAGSATQ